MLLAGSGPGFCGGYDLVESAEGMGAAARRGDGSQRRAGSPIDPAVVAANHDPRGTWDPMVDYAMMSRNVRGFMRLFHCGKPVVCSVHGFCVAGGTDMALCSDLLVIADGREDRLPAGARLGLADDRAVGAPGRRPACQAAAVHGRLAVGERGARVGPCDRGAPGRAAARSAPRSCSSGSPGCRSTS